MRIICVRAPRGIRGFLRLIHRRKQEKLNAVQRRFSFCLMHSSIKQRNLPAISPVSFPQP